MSEKEVEKLSLFISEAQKLWKQNPVFVTSEQFFRLWQENCEPMPFALPDKGLIINGKVIFKPMDLTPAPVVYSAWDPQELCPFYACELEHETLTVFIRITDNGIVFKNGPSLENPLEDNIHGEHVEAMFEVVKRIKDNYPNLDLRKTSDAVIKDTLRTLAADTQDKTFSKLISFHKIDRQRLLRKVLADMSEDELSSQLTLGLAMEDSSESDFELDNTPIPPCELAQRGHWELVQDLNLLLDAERQRLKEEDSVFFNFSQYQQLTPLENLRQIVSVTIDSELLAGFREGTRFILFHEGDPRTVFGTFVLDIIEKNALIGNIAWYSEDTVQPIDQTLFALPRKSPQEYIVHAIELFQKTVFDESMKSQSALLAVLGLTPMPYSFPPPGRSHDLPRLDEWQTCAVQSCINGANPVVLVQGPPGTGKTSVLEVVIRQLAAQKQRILVTAPSNTAVDNICRKIKDLPLLRHSSQKESVTADIAEQFWSGEPENCKRFEAKAAKKQCEIHASTHVGLLRTSFISAAIAENGSYDVIIFDEAGMSRTAEALLCMCLAKRSLFFGDPQQLPPFPLSENAIRAIREKTPVMTQAQFSFINSGLLTWLQVHRRFPAILLRTCYRCQNPRLMRFASLLFYNALVKTDSSAEYFRISYRERAIKYPPETLKFISTSLLPLELRKECLQLDGFQPGYENRAEAAICVKLILDNTGKYPLNEITVISPYKKQIRLIRQLLKEAPHPQYSDEEWHTFRHERIATVDSFQGGESDFVIISYVRSGGRGIGFVDDSNRVNVTHTRCRREMVVVGDLDFLKEKAESRIFTRMERGFERDGVIQHLTQEQFAPYATILKTLSVSDSEEPASELTSIQAAVNGTEPLEAVADSITQPVPDAPAAAASASKTIRKSKSHQSAKAQKPMTDNDGPVQMSLF